VGDRTTEKWSSKPEEPGGKAIKSGGSKAQMVEYFKHMPFSDVLGLNRVNDGFEGRCRVAVVCGDGGVVVIE